MAHASPQWDQYANWLILEQDQKERLNLPRTKEEYAQANKVSDRTLRRWQNDPMFKALVEKKLSTRGNNGLTAVSVDGTPAIISDDTEEVNDDEEYVQIKSALVKGAMTGDPKYLDLYFKTYGKDFVAEEMAAKNSDLAGLSLDNLIAESVIVVGETYLIDYLRSKGYEISERRDQEVRVISGGIDETGGEDLV
jgi:hypothetical protein